MVSRVLKNSIFLRIYAGLVVLVVVVAAFCYLLVQVINYQRAQEYRESLTDGISYVISEGVSRQPQKQQKLDWISDASDLLELPIYYVDAARVELSRTEKKRIAEQKSVVRYDANNGVGYIIIGLKDDAKHYLYIKVDKLGERQMKALPIFVLDYLIFYPGQEREYLERIKNIFTIRLRLPILKILI
jgi:two-component system sensor histidine kinase RstB